MKCTGTYIQEMVRAGWGRHSYAPKMLSSNNLSLWALETSTLLSLEISKRFYLPVTVKSGVYPQLLAYIPAHGLGVALVWTTHPSMVRTTPTRYFSGLWWRHTWFRVCMCSPLSYLPAMCSATENAIFNKTMGILIWFYLT